MVKKAVHDAFDKVEALQQEKINLSILKGFKSKAVVGVFQLDACLNWLELEELGAGVLTEFKEMASIIQEWTWFAAFLNSHLLGMT